MSTLRTTTAMALMTGAALTASASASAQVYKCPDASGRTVIQQIPCAGGEKMKVPSTGATNADVADTRSKAIALCEAALRSAPAWKDRDSVRISRLSRVGFTTVQMHGTTLAVVQYVAAVDAKNSYGAYGGDKPAYCYLNGTESKVLDVKVF